MSNFEKMCTFIAFTFSFFPCFSMEQKPISITDPLQSQYSTYLHELEHIKSQLANHRSEISNQLFINLLEKIQALEALIRADALVVSLTANRDDLVGSPLDVLTLFRPIVANPATPALAKNPLIKPEPIVAEQTRKRNLQGVVSDLRTAKWNFKKGRNPRKKNRDLPNTQTLLPSVEGMAEPAEAQPDDFTEKLVALSASISADFVEESKQYNPLSNWEQEATVPELTFIAEDGKNLRCLDASHKKMILDMLDSPPPAPAIEWNIELLSAELAAQKVFVSPQQLRTFVAANHPLQDNDIPSIPDL